MGSKTCRTCGQTQPLAEFYAHKMMSDGHLNHCKACVKARVKQHRADNSERVHEYERRRNSEPARKADRRRRLKDWRARCPEKNHAQQEVANAIARGRLQRQPCVKCGRQDSHGHHEDYSRPLDVVWLCPLHHAERHREIARERKAAF